MSTFPDCGFGLIGWIKTYLKSSSILPTIGPFARRLRGLVNSVFSKLRKAVDWEAFKRFLREIVDRDGLETTTSAVISIIGSVLMAAGVVMCLPATVTGLLTIIGFGTLGPVGGSIAAWIQSTFYGAYTCGLFSAVQSATMTAVPVVNILLICGLFATGVGAILKYYVAPRFKAPPPHDHAD